MKTMKARTETGPRRQAVDKVQQVPEVKGLRADSPRLEALPKAIGRELGEAAHI